MLSSPWLDAIAEYLLYLQAGGSPETTRATRRHHLVRVGRDLRHPWDTTPAELIEWFAVQDWARETRRSVRGTLRSFYRWAVQTGHTSTDLGALLPVVKASSPNPRPVPDDVYVRALMTASPREQLMLRLAAEMGMRRAEVATVNSRNLIEDLEGWSLVVLGKGDRERVVPVPKSLAVELRALPRGWAFPGDDHGHLSPRWVGTIVGRLLPEGWTMHKLRHRAASRWYDLERDVFTVQDLLGHASPATTRHYVAVRNDSLRRTVEGAA